MYIFHKIYPSTLGGGQLKIYKPSIPRGGHRLNLVKMLDFFGQLHGHILNYEAIKFSWLCLKQKTVILTLFRDVQKFAVEKAVLDSRIEDLFLQSNIRFVYPISMLLQSNKGCEI